MPRQEDIAVAYRNYYTHGQTLVRPARPIRWALDFFRKEITPIFSKVNPVHRDRKRLELMLLADEQPSRVLDVGCGDGSRLARLKNLGWTVFGQDIDAEAVCTARHLYGLDIRLGPLEESGFEERSFDFVILNHVIEHVHDPIQLLRECRRLLKKGGRLVLTTPNADSIGHRWFRADWRGLEPPRHIFVFSPKTLVIIGRRSGFSVLRSWTTSANAHTFSNGSLQIRHEGRRYSFGLGAFQTVYRTLYQYCASVIGVLDPNSGEECVLQLEC